MDPFSAEGELVNIQSEFHQGQYHKVTEFLISSLSPSNQLPARVLQLRAQIALRQYDGVISELNGEDDTPDLAALRAFAQYSKDPWDAEDAMKTVERLVTEEADNMTVQLLCGTILANQGRSEEAVALLAKHQGSLDAVALLVQIHLQNNRLDLAIKETKQTRSWAQDSLLVNLAESWVGLREGGDSYQRAFYVFEELAQSPSTSSQKSLLSQGLAELHLHRFDEASAALDQALAIDSESPDVLANLVVLNTIHGKGKEAQDMRERLEAVNKDHQLLTGLRDRKAAFDAALAKYNPRFEP